LEVRRNLDWVRRFHEVPIGRWQKLDRTLELHWECFDLIFHVAAAVDSMSKVDDKDFIDQLMDVLA
jgi:hypothetical protein